MIFIKSARVALGQINKALSLIFREFKEFVLLQSHLPFAVVGSNDEVKIGNKMVKARQYPWGTVQGTHTAMNSP